MSKFSGTPAKVFIEQRMGRGGGQSEVKRWAGQ